jgi:beta-lactamase regulating signal transducer with metallopeptidase domain
MFYFAYMMLLRKETFFTTNRWFLLSGLFTSVLLPLFFIKKVILVDAPKPSLEELATYTATNTTALKEIPAAVETFDWIQLLWISYFTIALLLVLKIVFSFFSLYKLLYKEQVVKQENFKLINLNKNIAPFSFFNYVVLNPSLYTEAELQSILLHEKIHSQQKHSIDVLVTKLFCIVFWFNPIVWLYKKAVLQNLEYIADQKATAQLEDKKSYQIALLKAVTNQSCLSITNNFYQSLIKKRIVMLNTNQSHKRNSWKYALIIPALIGFVFLFQIKTIAQEKIAKIVWNEKSSADNGDDVSVTITKKTTDAELKRKAKKLKEEHDVKLKYSKVKRNNDGEITAIKLEYKDKNGNKGVSQINGDEPIAPIQFYKTDNKIGFGKPKEIHFVGNGKSVAINGDKIRIIAPEAPESPEVPEAPEAPEWTGDFDFDFNFSDNMDDVKKIIIQNGKTPKVIVNGKVVTDKAKIKKMLKGNGKNRNYNFVFSSDEDGTHEIIIDNDKIMEITNDAMEKAMVEIKRVRPEVREKVRAEIAKARAEISKSRAEMDKAREEMRHYKPESEKERAEMIKTREEIEKVRAELDKTRAELEKEKAKLKK